MGLKGIARVQRYLSQFVRGGGQHLDPKVNVDAFRVTVQNARKLEEGAERKGHGYT